LVPPLPKFVPVPPQSWLEEAFMRGDRLVEVNLDDQVGGGIGYLRLSDKGYRVAKAGEHWWASLPWKDKLKARLGHQV
jgi:hypothetical protein